MPTMNFPIYIFRFVIFQYADKQHGTKKMLLVEVYALFVARYSSQKLVEFDLS
jgi:hypothetical protein